MKRNEIRLSEGQRRELEQFANKGKHSVHLVKRARAILALDGSNKTERVPINKVCEQEGLSRQSVYMIRKDFQAAGSVTEFLTRKQRETPPVPAKVTGEVEAHVVALACTKPPEGCARWTLTLLAQKSVELGFVESISYVSVDRLLKKRNISLT